ncbi:MAG: hypothetical protein ACKVLE_04230, partial [Fidelibacterota bacterium]
MHRYLSLLLFIGLVFWSCNLEKFFEPEEDVELWACTADDGTEGVELWGVCYSIEDTDTLYLYNNQLTGSIPSEIGNLTNL